MRPTIFTRVPIILVIIILILLAFSLTFFVAAQAAFASDLAWQDPPLYHKSALGLMPPAYGAASAQRDALSQPASAASGLFAPFVVYPSGSWPEAVAAGEFSGDSLLDAALTTSFDWSPISDNRLHLFNQTAGGTLAHTLDLTAGSSPIALASGDFNRDGRRDLVLVNQDQNTLSMFIQQVGGAWAEGVTYSTGASPDGLAAGDFNSDLCTDIAVSHAISQSAGLFYQQTDGTFAAPVYFGLGSGGFNDLAVGDLNSDGFDDLVVLRGAGYHTNQAAIFYQESYALNDPVFVTAEDGGYLTHGVAVGDVTADGRDDLIITAGGNTPNAYLNVFVQQPDGSLAAPVTYPAFHLPEAVRVGDVNHDGRNDVVVVHAAWMTLSTYLQQADGTLAAYQTDALPYRDYYRPDSLDLADVNNDGALDVLVANHSSLPAENGLVVLTNTGDAPTSTITTPASTGVFLTDATTAYTITGLTSVDAVTLTISLDGGKTWISQPASPQWSYVWSVPPESRLYNVMTKAINAEGKVQSPAAHKRILVLNSDPSASLHIQYDAEYTNVPTITLKVSTLDLLEAVRFADDGDPFGEWMDFTPTIPWVLTGPDGTSTIIAQARNPLGTLTAPFSDTIILDRVAPTGEITLAAGVEYTSIPTVTISLSVADATSGVAEVCLGDGTQPCVWHPYPGAFQRVLEQTDGIPQQVCVIFRDRAMNQSTAVCDTITLDRSFPQGSLVINDQAQFTNQVTVTLAITATDENSGLDQMRFSQNGLDWGEWLPFTISHDFVLSSQEGERTVFGQIVDKAGNIGATFSDTIVLDQEHPVGSVLINEGDLYTKDITATLTVTATDETSGLDQMRFSLDGVDWGSWIPFALLRNIVLPSPDGSISVFGQVIDRAGNVSETFNDTIILDRHSPTGTVVINDGDFYTTDPIVTLQLTAQDATSDVCWVNVRNSDQAWGEWMPYTPVMDWQLSAHLGLQAVEVIYQDCAGNESTVYSDTITMINRLYLPLIVRNH